MVVVMAESVCGGLFIRIKTLFAMSERYTPNALSSGTKYKYCSPAGTPAAWAIPVTDNPA